MQQKPLQSTKKNQLGRQWYDTAANANLYANWSYESNTSCTPSPSSSIATRTIALFKWRIITAPTTTTSFALSFDWQWYTSVFIKSFIKCTTIE